MSILLTKFDYAPFKQIKNSDYLSSIEIAINEFKSEIDLPENLIFSSEHPLKADLNSTLP